MAENTTGKRKFARESLGLFTGVRVNVPNINPNVPANMKFFPKASFTADNGKVITIPDRWQSGFLAKPAIYVNCKLVDKTIGEKDGLPVTIKVKAGGTLLKKAVICGRNFYEISEADLGKPIIATVEVIKKIEIGGDGEVFLMLDITKMDGATATADLKIVQGSTGDFLIPGSDFRVKIINRKHAEKKELAKAA
jgi:hypothetical protein